MDIDLAALRAIERDKEIPIDYLIRTLENALLNAYQRTDSPLCGVKIEIGRKTGRVAVLAPEFDDDDSVIGFYDDTPTDFGRVAAATARQVVFQRIQEAEDDQKYGHFSGTEGDILTDVIQADRDSHAVRVDLGSLEAIMPQAEQVVGEKYPRGKRLEVYVVSTRRELRGPQVVVSRTHPNLVHKLLALEVSEIIQGVIEIREVARETSHRSKIAMSSKNPDVSVKGTCIGPMGQRVRTVTNELSDRKIDIVDWSEDLRRFVATTPSPTKVLFATVANKAIHTCRAIVPDYQLSLAIGHEEQNARLTVKLTGWRINIQPGVESTDS